jgi:hypothetical protein
MIKYGYLINYYRIHDFINRQIYGPNIYLTIELDDMIIHWTNNLFIIEKQVAYDYIIIDFGITHEGKQIVLIERYFMLEYYIGYLPIYNNELILINNNIIKDLTYDRTKLKNLFNINLKYIEPTSDTTYNINLRKIFSKCVNYIDGVDDKEINIDIDREKYNKIIYIILFFMKYKIINISDMIFKEIFNIDDTEQINKIISKYNNPFYDYVKDDNDKYAEFISKCIKFILEKLYYHDLSFSTNDNYNYNVLLTGHITSTRFIENTDNIILTNSILKSPLHIMGGSFNISKYKYLKYLIKNMNVKQCIL